MGRRTGINAMEVIEVRREPQSLNRAFNVRLDMGRRVGNTSVAKDIEATLGGDCMNYRFSQEIFSNVP